MAKTSREDVISLRDVYEAVNSLETKIDRRVEKLEDRVEEQDNFLGQIRGVGITISFVFAGFGLWVWSRLTGKV